MIRSLNIIKSDNNRYYLELIRVVWKLEAFMRTEITKKLITIIEELDIECSNYEKLISIIGTPNSFAREYLMRCEMDNSIIVTNQNRECEICKFVNLLSDL